MQKKAASCLLELMISSLLLILVAVFGISAYTFYVAIRPNVWNQQDYCNTATDDDEALEVMYSDYPQLKRWVAKLRHECKLKEDTIRSRRDGRRLHAYYIAADKPTRRTAVIIHGYRSSALEMLHIAYLYSHDLHYNVLLPDLSSHGKSQGNYIGFGWNDRWDVLEWMDKANELFTLPDGRETQMIVHGISMGAATTMFVAGHTPQPAYVVAYIEDCGYTSAFDEIAYVANRDYHLPARPFVSLASQICKWSYGWTFEEASCVEAVKKATKPMLFIHGSADRYVPCDMVYKLYEAKPNNKDIWTVKDVIHGRCYHDYPKEYTEHVSKFINQYLY